MERFYRFGYFVGKTIDQFEDRGSEEIKRHYSFKLRYLAKQYSQHKEGRKLFAYTFGKLLHKYTYHIPKEFVDAVNYVTEQEAENLHLYIKSFVLGMFGTRIVKKDYYM